jgi:hypothetical protein
MLPYGIRPKDLISGHRLAQTHRDTETDRRWRGTTEPPPRHRTLITVRGRAIGEPPGLTRNLLQFCPFRYFRDDRLDPGMAVGVSEMLIPIGASLTCVGEVPGHDCGVRPSRRRRCACKACLGGTPRCRCAPTRAQARRVHLSRSLQRNIASFQYCTIVNASARVSIEHECQVVKVLSGQVFRVHLSCIMSICSEGIAAFA